MRAAKGAVRLVKMNIDDHPAIAGQLGIQSIPAVIAFVNGQPVDGFIGALPESQVKAFIDRVAGPPARPSAESLIDEAEALFADGDIAGAAERFGAGAEARAAIGAGDRRPRPLPTSPAATSSGARQTLAMLPESAASRPEGRRRPRRSSSSPARPPRSATPAALEARIAANPTDHQARFDLALLLNAKGDRAGAVDHLLEIHAQRP